ncbi:fumarylacetoacetate hydrolase family protein [Bradyrhizobium sp. WSM3983]|uniref:fumarylacetoacetate hydrolase family protein n=1 Tax=Bradyrhizobium sp. WSM3983 TaxID=1038867 RepID=UPI000425B895|nr:fumarylacetoacetate hydrolase family protein [Bradyrhizobium sp. WSM3983]
MWLCQFNERGFGLVEGNEIVDLTHLLEELPATGYPYPTHDTMIAALPDLLPRIADAKMGPRLPLASVRLQAPVRNPGKFVAAPVNYAKHHEETIADPATFAREHVRKIQETGLFLKATSSSSGPSDPIRTRFPDRRTDHEIELAAVIGRAGSNIAAADALSYIAGYCIGLDITVRGPEERSLRKSIDSYSVLGPWLVTADEIPDPSGLNFELSVNGEIRQKANTSDLIMSVPELIEFASRYYTLHPGDVLFTGTPEGVGPIQPGDKVHANIERIGSISISVDSSE